MNFYVGFHHPGRAHKVDRPVMLSANALRGRKSDIEVGEWLLDSGAFSQIQTHGAFQSTASEYASMIERWHECGDLRAAVTQDYMCEPQIRDITGGTVEDHQAWTIQRYDDIRSHLSDVYLMPVLQGWTAGDYVEHLQMYGDRLGPRAWVGVGSICKRNSSPADIEWVLKKIRQERPDLRLHGFGVKSTALQRTAIRDAFYSTDSMAWSYAARKRGGDANSPIEARKFYDQLTKPQAPALFA